MNNGSLQRQVHMPKEIIALLGAMGMQIPDNIKEIETPTEYSEETKKIILPVGMDKLSAARELEAQWKNEETKNDFEATFQGWNWQDVLVAIRRVTEREFGWMNGQSSWWSGDPTQIDIVVDVKDGKKLNESAFWGDFQITGWDKAQAKIHMDRAGIIHVNINAKRKFNEPITAYFNLIREQLEKASIYRGKNIVVTKGAKGGVDFEIVENKGSDKIILNRDEQLVVDTFITGSLGDPGKRIYLFTGAYGTGKTETAMRVGRIAVAEYGISFFYIRDSSMFEDFLSLSKKYQPCLIFMEDIDEIASGDRDARINKILNTTDGYETKGYDLKVILTTNHPEKINSALRRPGRIDQIVKFENPDHAAKMGIYKSYLLDLPGGEFLDYDFLARETPNIQGAVIAEMAKRAFKLAKKENAITDDLVSAAIASMKYQIELMTEPVEKSNKPEQFVKLLTSLIAEKIWQSDEGKSVINYCN